MIYGNWWTEHNARQRKKRKCARFCTSPYISHTSFKKSSYSSGQLNSEFCMGNFSIPLSTKQGVKRKVSLSAADRSRFKNIYIYIVEIYCFKVVWIRKSQHMYCCGQLNSVVFRDRISDIITRTASGLVEERLLQTIELDKWNLFAQRFLEFEFSVRTYKRAKL